MPLRPELILRSDMVAVWAMTFISAGKTSSELDFEVLLTRRTFSAGIAVFVRFDRHGEFHSRFSRVTVIQEAHGAEQFSIRRHTILATNH